MSAWTSDINMASGWQHSSLTSLWPLATTWTTDIKTAFSGSLDYRHEHGLPRQHLPQTPKNCKLSAGWVKYSLLVEITDAETYAQRRKEASVSTGHTSGKGEEGGKFAFVWILRAKCFWDEKKSSSGRMQDELWGHRFLSERVRTYTTIHWNMPKKLLLWITACAIHNGACSNLGATPICVQILAQSVCSRSPLVHTVCSHCIIMDLQLVTLGQGALRVVQESASKPTN